MVKYKCSCGKEIELPVKEKTFILDVNGKKIEIESEIHDKNKKFNEVTPPKGWRFLEINEVITLFNSEYLDQIMPKEEWNWFFFEQPFNYNQSKDLVAVAIRNRYSELNLNLYREPYLSEGRLGFLFCREVKK